MLIAWLAELHARPALPVLNDGASGPGDSLDHQSLNCRGAVIMLDFPAPLVIVRATSRGPEVCESWFWLFERWDHMCNALRSCIAVRKEVWEVLG